MLFMSGRRLGVWIAAAGLAAGLILGLVPTRHTYPTGVRKDVGFVEEQTVLCSYLFVPRSPTVRGYDDECDHARYRRLGIMVLIVASGLLIGGITVGIPKIRSRIRTDSHQP